ncbi:MAG: dienelactone hydrolase family protein [Paludibacteraceae bacterium]
MKKVAFLFLIFVCVINVSAQNELFEKREFVYKGDTLKYRVLFPDNYDKTRKYPLVLFLHGAGERGSDNEKQLTHGGLLFTNLQNRRDYPSIVIFPQCPENEFWVKIDERNNNIFSFPDKPKISTPLLLVKKLVDSYKKTESIDKKKVYILGLSMGGMGTFDMICRYPRYFAAAIPICGGVYEPRLKKARKMPIRIFHGAADNVVNINHSRNAYYELKADGSQRAELIIFPGVGHNSWDDAFAYPDFLGWMYYHEK